MGLFIRFQILLLLSSTLLFSCANKSDTAEANGDVLVKIGVQNSSFEYSLRVVQLKGIEKLHEVSGAFVKFFFSPGASGNQLTGNSPRAQFVHSQNFFVPSDMISMQMAAIYFHLQSLAEFDKVVGADGVNQWPRSVGLETQIQDNSAGLQKNNAFYNGQTDSMMFVPYTQSNLPIAVNAGIIAHEHFHSLFYKMVIAKAFKAQKISSASASIHAEESSKQSADEEHMARSVKMSSMGGMTEQERVQLFNETLLRGMNEGLADFWAWVYTGDPDFIRWSLANSSDEPDLHESRSLNLAETEKGKYVTTEMLEKKIQEANQFYSNPKALLINYSYKIGTPYARFLKQMSAYQADAKQISLNDSKKIMAQVVFNYVRDLGEKAKTLKENDRLEPLSLFDYVAKLAEENSLLHLDQISCEFLLKYINLNQVDQPSDKQKLSSCKEKFVTQKGQKDSSFVVVKP